MFEQQHKSRGSVKLSFHFCKVSADLSSWLPTQATAEGMLMSEYNNQSSLVQWILWHTHRVAKLLNTIQCISQVHSVDKSQVYSDFKGFCNPHHNPRWSLQSQQNPLKPDYTWPPSTECTGLILCLVTFAICVCHKIHASQKSQPLEHCKVD